MLTFMMVRKLLALSRVRKSKIAICFYFFGCGATLGNFASLLPAVKDEHDLSTGTLGAILVAAVAGAMVSIPVVTSISSYYGSGSALFFGFLAQILLYNTIGIGFHIAIFVIGVFCLGFGAGWTDIAMNNHAVLCEKLARHPTLGLFFAVNSIGALAGALLGGLLLTLDMTVLEVTAIFSGTFLIPSLFVSVWLFSSSEEKLIESQSGILTNDEIHADKPNNSSDSNLLNGETSTGSLIIGAGTVLTSNFSNHRNTSDGKNSNNSSYIPPAPTHQISPVTSALHNVQSIERKLSTQSEVPITPQLDWQEYPQGSKDVDHRALYSLCLLAFFGFFCEGSIGDWSAIFFSSELDASPIEQVLGYVAFCLLVSIGRYRSDHLVSVYGRKRVLQYSGVIAGAGIALAASSIYIGDKTVSLAVAIIGFAICGAGMGVIAPSVISLAGSSIRGMPSAEAIACVSSVGYVGIMVGPPLLGGIAQVLDGVGYAFYIDALLMAMVTVIVTTFEEKSVERQQSRTSIGSRRNSSRSSFGRHQSSNSIENVTSREAYIYSPVNPGE